MNGRFKFNSVFTFWGMFSDGYSQYRLYISFDLMFKFVVVWLLFGLDSAIVIDFNCLFSLK